MSSSVEARLESRLERYRAFDAVNRPYLEWQLAAFRPFLGQRVLEVGCGVGSILELLAPRERLFGIDVEPEVLDFARARFNGEPGFGFERMDAGRLDEAQAERLRRERFDSLVCINVLEHIEDDPATLAAFHRILEPGGVAAILVPAHQWLYGPCDGLDGHFRRYSRAQFGDAFARLASGFCTCATSTWSARWAGGSSTACCAARSTAKASSA